MAEFGIHSFANSAPTPAPERKAPPKPPKTPKSKRKGRDEPDPSKPKVSPIKYFTLVQARRDSEATPEPSAPAEDKENTQVGDQWCPRHLIPSHTHLGRRGGPRRALPTTVDSVAQGSPT